MVVKVQVTSNPEASFRSTHRLCVFPCESCKPMRQRQRAKTTGSGRLALGCPRASLLLPHRPVVKLHLLVPSQELSASWLIPPCPWHVALLPCWHWAGSHHTSTGTGAVGAARTWQGKQAAKE